MELVVVGWLIFFNLYVLISEESPREDCWRIQE
jgi:hypothetical protein